jgi:hypothetical protein
MPVTTHVMLTQRAEWLPSMNTSFLDEPPPETER